MLQTFKNLFLFFLIVNITLPSAWASSPLIQPPFKKKEALQQFYSFHQSLFKKHCPTGTDHRYYQLLKKYRGDGYYIPSTQSGKLDITTIKEHLPMIKKKIEWINLLIMQTKKLRYFPRHRSLVRPLQRTINQLLRLKKQYDFSKDPAQARKIAQSSKQLIIKLRNQFSQLTQKIPFLLSFGYPVDHLRNRRNYDLLKLKKDNYSTQRANATFFKRKLYEDGAFDTGRIHSDLFVRSTIDTLSIKIKRSAPILSEELRHDLEWLFTHLEKFLRGGKTRQITRLTEWKNRTQRALDYYQHLLKDSKGNTAAEKARATADLRDFIYQRHAAIYYDVQKAPKWIQALFVMSTILIHEVGDGPMVSDLDRIDVAQVVVNRFHGKRYSFIPKDDSLYSYLEKRLSRRRIRDNKWLNVLFKESEFSFTYFFIPSVVHIFCPNQSGRGKRLLRHTSGLAFDLLNKPRFDFKATR